MTTSHLISKWSVLGVIATILAAVATLVVINQAGAHSDIGPTTEISVHVCIDQGTKTTGTVFAIQPNDNCDPGANVPDLRKHWATWEAFISELAAGVTAECPPARGILNLLAGLDDNGSIFTNAEIFGDLNNDGLIDMSTVEADAFLYTLLSSGGYGVFEPEFLDPNALPPNQIPNPNFNPNSDTLVNPLKTVVIDGISGFGGAGVLGAKINRAQAQLKLDHIAHGDEFEGDSWAQDVLRALGESFKCEGDHDHVIFQGGAIIGGSTQSGEATLTGESRHLDVFEDTYVGMFAGASSQDASLVEVVLPADGAVGKFWVRLDEDISSAKSTGKKEPSQGQGWVFTVWKNGGPTDPPVTCTISTSLTATGQDDGFTCRDLVHVGDFVAGDRIAVKAAPLAEKRNETLQHGFNMSWSAIYGN